jgi:hypothetical protein
MCANLQVVFKRIGLEAASLLTMLYQPVANSCSSWTRSP